MSSPIYFRSNFCRDEACCPERRCGHCLMVFDRMSRLHAPARRVPTKAPTLKDCIEHYRRRDQTRREREESLA